jgi:hypothetical protein
MASLLATSSIHLSRSTSNEVPTATSPVVSHAMNVHRATSDLLVNDSTTITTNAPKIVTFGDVSSSKIVDNNDISSSSDSDDDDSQKKKRKRAKRR